MNEETTIVQVIKGFKESLPDATIYVYDNASEDETALKATEAGAQVVFEPTLGKGQIVRRMYLMMDS